ncbi:ABC transporter [Pseudomonas sp. SDI]|uniref:ATP-binding cassette domain-containing protein n=1 Tax=Pseudomonas sp. SDI TaxID=2170734 RepID=UPI000DE685BD|nr:ABC transporter ATP-binding protein [Pseudomonas sp. SDI]PWB35885.1 ABC transporter [Pseudomonas sp. SDI]
MNLLSVINISHHFGNKQLFNDASLDIEKGKLTGLLGPNGSGKTTFFDMLCGLLPPQHGTVSNSATTQLYLSQTLSTPTSLRMDEIFKLLSALSCTAPPSNADINAKLAEWPSQIGERYRETSKRKPAVCSYGEIRCFFTLSLLLLPCELIILDEPTAGVDPEFRYYIWQCLRQAADQGVTVLVSSHYIEEIANHCDIFHSIIDTTFATFNCSKDYLKQFGASTLDEAFIKSLSHSRLASSSTP